MLTCRQYWGNPVCKVLIWYTTYRTSRSRAFTLPISPCSTMRLWLITLTEATWERSRYCCTNTDRESPDWDSTASCWDRESGSRQGEGYSTVSQSTVSQMCKLHTHCLTTFKSYDQNNLDWVFPTITHIGKTCFWISPPLVVLHQ